MFHISTWRAATQEGRGNYPTAVIDNRVDPIVRARCAGNLAEEPLILCLRPVACFETKLTTPDRTRLIDAALCAHTATLAATWSRYCDARSRHTCWCSRMVHQACQLPDICAGNDRKVTHVARKSFRAARPRDCVPCARRSRATG